MRWVSQTESSTLSSTCSPRTTLKWQTPPSHSLFPGGKTPKNGKTTINPACYPSAAHLIRYYSRYINSIIDTTTLIVKVLQLLLIYFCFNLPLPIQWIKTGRKNRTQTQPNLYSFWVNGPNCPQIQFT